MSHSSHKWIKVWTTILTDPDLDNLSLANIGRWSKLLLYVKMHGEKGVLKMPEPARTFCNHMQVKDLNEFNEIAKILPNVEVSCNGKNGVTIYTMKNWFKYQVDDSYDRVQKHREIQNSVTPQDKNKIREEKNKNKKREDKIIKHKYGEFQKVLLTDAEYEKLKDRFGAERELWITKLDRGIEQKGYKYKSHYLTIIDWSEREDKKRSEFI